MMVIEVFAAPFADTLSSDAKVAVAAESHE